MAEKNTNFTHISKEKFAFVNEGERLTDQKFEDKPIGYFKDAWIRFRKSKAAVAATVIIVLIILLLLRSCGSGMIYDGSFSGKLVPGYGVAAAALKEDGIKVIGEKSVNEIF